MKRIFLSLIFILGIALQIQADNILSASSASGHPNDTVLMQLSLNNTDNVVAFQTEIPLGTSLSYIPNSCVLSSRSNGHSISATVVNGVLKILSYSLSLASYSGNSGVLATFRLRLGNEPGNISLALNNSRLSNSSGVALGITTNNGTITLLSPKIRINNPQIDFGHYPIRSTYNNSISVTNIGNEPLVVNSLNFSNPSFFSNNFSQTTVSSGNTISIPISFLPTIAGNVSATVTIHSNSISGNQNVSLIANPYSVNELHIANVEGYSDSIVNIDLSINNMDTLVGFQTKFILPQALEYISGSFILSNRSNNHICLSGINGDTLTLLVYSPNNTPLRNNSGIIASFSLRLNGSSGGYYLQPLNTVLSNRNGINVLSDAYSGTVSIRSPYIYCNNNINMGLSSVTQNSIYNYSINNYGNAPLVINNIVFTQNGFLLQDSLPITINQYNNRNINIIYNGINEGNFSALMKIYSNDPTHRLVDVNVSGNRYEPNELAFSVDTVNYSQNPQVAVNMNNYSPITAVQFDFYYPHNYYNLSSSDFVLSSTRCPSHSISTIALNDSVWRVLVFSMQNQNITGSNGTLLNITLHPKTTTRQGIYRVRASGVILSNSAGVNKLTGENPSYNFNVLIPTYTVSALSNNNTMGTISGVGIYNYLSTATLIATPNLHCIFLHWNDNSTNRTRNITVSQDTTFTAYFKRIDTTYIRVEICQGSSYNFYGQTLTSTNNYSHTVIVGQYQDSVYILNLTVNQTKTTNLQASICQGQAYTLNGFNVSTAGLHTLNLQTYKGCDSTVNLTLTVNQPKTTNLTAEICQGQTYTLNGFNTSTSGLHTLDLQTYKGCDSTVNLTLTVNQPAITNLTAEICQGNSYTLNGFNTSIAGLHTLNLQTYKGCDSTVNLTLTINQPAITNLTAEICQGETYNLNGFNTSTAGLHTLNLQTYKGCDSTVNLTLTVNQPATTNLEAEICQGETYTLNGFNTSTSGLHTQNLQTYKGCDSTVNLTLTINQPAITNLTAEICQGQTYNLNGFNTSTAGFHTQNLQTYKGCDSTVNLNLTVNQSAITNLEAEICQGQTYNLNGFNTSTSGLHTLDLQTYKGCDSTVNLTLTVNQPATTNLTAEICQGNTYTLNGFNTSTAGLHTLNLQTYKGCDSTVNLNLTVNQSATTNLTAEICQGETYTLNGFNVNTAGLYNLNLQTINGCDSTVNLALTVNELITPTNLALDNIANYFEFTWQGNGESYVIYRNNDSIATINVNIYQDANVTVGTNYCYKVKALNSTCESELSGEICQIFSGLNDIINNEISVTLYPNPTDNRAILEIEGLTNQSDVIVYDLYGRAIKSYKLNLGQKELEIDVKGFAKGVYNIRIVNDKNNITKKLIVR